MGSVRTIQSPPAQGQKLVSLCAFRDRSGAASRADTRDEGYAPIAHIMEAVERELAADGMLVAWHEAEREPRFLFASGTCEPGSEAERDMLIAASQAVAVCDASSATGWANRSDDRSGAALLTTRIAGERGIVTVTSRFHKLGGAARVHARDASARLLPLVQAFFGMWSLRSAATSRARGLAAALDSSDVGTLLLDRDGQIVFANLAAEQLIARGDGLRRKGTMLGGTRLADTLRLQAAIEHVVQAEPEPGSTGAGPAPVVALHRKDRRPLLAAIVPAAGAAPGEVDTAAILYVFDPDQELAPLLIPVCRLYGLSPVETRLACLLATGSSLVDAASAMRIQEQTARSYLKQVFQKTETNRQAELVWLLLKSAVRTAPGCRTSFV